MFIWMGSAICVPALMVGGMIGAGMKIGPAFLAMIAGFVLVCIYMILIGIQGSDLGMPTTAIFPRAYHFSAFWQFIFRRFGILFFGVLAFFAIVFPQVSHLR